MTATTVAVEYLRLRKKYPHNPASQTILWARGNLKPTQLAWTSFVGDHLAVGTGKRDGFNIRVEVDQSQEVTHSYSETDRDTGIRNPSFRWSGDEYYSRQHSRFIELESESTVRDLAKEYHRTGDAKNVAWERARISLQEEVEAYIDGDVVEVIATAYASIKSARLGVGGGIGSEIMMDDIERECDNIVAETDIIEVAIEEAREEAAELREALATIV